MTLNKAYEHHDEPERRKSEPEVKRDMKTILAYAGFFFCFVQVIYAQSAGWLLIFPPVYERMPPQGYTHREVYETKESCEEAVATNSFGGANENWFYLCERTDKNWSVRGPVLLFTDPSAPIQKWEVHKAFDSAAECEREASFLKSSIKKEGRGALTFERLLWYRCAPAGAFYGQR